MNKTSLASFVLSALSMSIILSCGHGGENSAEDAVDSFAVAYFNWRFADARPYATLQSQRWLSFAASQVTQQDIDTLRSMAEGAEIKTENVTYRDDSTAEATVRVRNFMALDSIGHSPHIVHETRFTLPLTLRNNQWLVNIEALPRQEP